VWELELEWMLGIYSWFVLYSSDSCILRMLQSFQRYSMSVRFGRLSGDLRSSYKDHYTMPAWALDLQLAYPETQCLRVRLCRS
jgi:hypothetical protein